ncbi:RNA polymerase sigma-70 factor (ECF subfamily) [Dyadobacter jejuensis]|uniref:RNA polymerase sigma-70 factor (ECF subfamily) n=1 Tax=Dyadobacter jejuensis TaxID=1082580 RepID=A0A316ALF4_9BACT|nr:RNA polymerase sigma-70 factor [Dyadobacter jejuensis]PWJ57884.1 RNA polymerase sigma-70 factor (ECF subfamily) [Dyadobacter jejuensis]
MGQTTDRIPYENPSKGLGRTAPEARNRATMGEFHDELFIKNVFETNPEKGVELLYRRYFQPLCSHAIKYVGSKVIAEDLVSEIFFEFYKGKIYERITNSYRFYLYRSVRNNCYSHLKTEMRRSESIYEPAPAHMEHSEIETPESISQFEELYQDVQNAVSTLPINRRRIYLMNRFEGMRYQEIADELNLSVKTVEVQLYRANKLIRALLKEKWFLLLVLSVS